MIDSSTQRPVRVLGDITYGSIIEVAVSQLDLVRKLLSDNDIPHWVENNFFWFDDRPPVAFINVRKGTDPLRVQALFDAVE